MLHRIISNLPEPRDTFRRTLSQCGSLNSARWIVALMALYLHLGPFSRVVIERIENMLVELGPVSLEPSTPAEQARSTSMV